MGAGPVPIPQAVAQANGVIINHLGPTMDRVIQNVKRMAGYAFQTRSTKIIGLAGPGSAAMEMAVSNTCWPGRRVLCLKSGTFSGRLGEMARGRGGGGHLPGKRSRAPGVRRAGARRPVEGALRRGDHGARRDVVRREAGGPAGGVPPREGARRPDDRRRRRHAGGDAGADGRLGHRRVPHGRAEGAVVHPWRVDLRVLRRRLARRRAPSRLRGRTGATTRCAPSASGASSSTTTPRRCPACWRSTRRCGWWPRKRSSAASCATR